MTHESKNANTKKANRKSEAEKQAAREAREAKRIQRTQDAAAKACAWEQAHGLANMAGAHERMKLLVSAAFINSWDAADEKTKGETHNAYDDAVAYIREAVRTLATPDLRAVLAAVPAHVLAKAVRADGSLKTSTIAREMAQEMAKKPQTALAVAHAAADAQRKAARKARQKAKKEAAKAQGKAGVK